MILRCHFVFFSNGLFLYFMLDMTVSCINFLSGDSVLVLSLIRASSMNKS